MVESMHVPSLPQNSENESSGHSPWRVTTLSAGASVAGAERRGFSNSRITLFPTPTAQLSPERGCRISHPERNEVVAQNPLKRPRGRPFGSKNKPKPTVAIREDIDNTKKLVLIEIPSGNDIVETLINFARYHNANILVLSGSGLVSDISLNNPMSLSPAFPMRGTFSLMSIFGTYINDDCGHVPPQFITNHDFSPFSICISGFQGQIVGGVVAKKIMSAGSVLVTATLFRNHEFHKVEFLNGILRDVIIKANHTHVVPSDTNDTNNNTTVGSTLGVAGSNSSSMNHQLLPPPPTGVSLMECNPSPPTDGY